MSRRVWSYIVVLMFALNGAFVMATCAAPADGSCGHDPCPCACARDTTLHALRCDPIGAPSGGSADGQWTPVSGGSDLDPVTVAALTVVRRVRLVPDGLAAAQDRTTNRATAPAFLAHAPFLLRAPLSDSVPVVHGSRVVST